MKRRFGPILIALGLLSASCVWAQTDSGTSDTGAPTQPGPQPAFTYPDAKPSMDFLSGSLENSSITLGIGTGFTYDSNAFRSSVNSAGRWLFQVTPNIAIQQFRPKLSWHLSYSGGFQTYTNPSTIQNTGNTNTFAQYVTAGFRWQMSPRWQMEGSNTFSYTSDPFSSSTTTPGSPTQNNPNQVSSVPLTQYKLNAAVLELTNRLSNTDSLAFVGTQNLRDTSTYNLVTSVPFYNLISYGGRANYNHRLSSRLTLGAGYNYNSLDFGRGQQRSGIQTFQFTVDYVLRPNMSISGWIGPEYTSTKSVLAIPIPGTIPLQFISLTGHNSLWSIAGGATFSWRGARNAFQASFSRQVNDGGGVIATAQVLQVNGSYRRQMTQKLDLLANLGYFHNTSTTLSIRTFNNIYSSVGVTYRLMRSVSANAYYYYVHQAQSTAILIGPNSYNDNRYAVSINYSWNHPLGR